MTSAPDLPDLAQALLAAARRAGAQSADALVIDSRSLSVDWRDGALEHVERAEGLDLGLRVFVGRRQACVAASDRSTATIDALAERAVAMAREAPEDPHAGLADPDQLSARRDARDLDLIDPSPEPDADWLARAAAAAEGAGLSVAGVSRSDGAGAGWGQRRMALAATNGFAGDYARSSISLSATMITGEGTAMDRDWSGEMRLHRADLPDPAEIGRRAGERAAARAGARKPQSGAFPVLYDERVAGGLIGHLMSAINGASVARGSSWLREAMGQPVLPAGLSLIEDPLRPRSTGARPFDAEGLPTAPRAWVQDGILTGWVLDLASARKLGMSPTGNASRGTAGPPSPSTGNLELTQGSASPADLMRQMGTGLLVTSMLGATINPTTGDYSRGASGFWIERGEIAYPVHEATIAGNLRDMLRTLVPANDARPWAGVRVPSLLVEGLTIAGA
jgi:PmbA protein